MITVYISFPSLQTFQIKSKSEAFIEALHLMFGAYCKCEAIFANRALCSVAKMCRAFQINRCVYYRWLRHKGLVFHSDRGCQYSSKKYKAMLEENGITESMSSPGCPYDNSCMESFLRA